MYWETNASSHVRKRADPVDCLYEKRDGRALCILHALLSATRGNGFRFFVPTGRWCGLIYGGKNVIRFCCMHGEMLFALLFVMTRCCGPLWFYGESVWPALWGENAVCICCVHGEMLFAFLWSTLVLRGECVARFMGKECGLHLLCAWGDAVRLSLIHI